MYFHNMPERSHNSSVRVQQTSVLFFSLDLPIIGSDVPQRKSPKLQWESQIQGSNFKKHVKKQEYYIYAMMKGANFKINGKIDVWARLRTRLDY